jgi:hypothetical protein
MLLAIYKASERATYEANKQEQCAPDHAKRDQGATWHLPDGKNPGTGEAMRRELLKNESPFLVYSWYIFIVRRLVLLN